jgi:flagellin
MGLSIVSNQAASIATRQLEQSNDAATATAEKLSSGKRINSAKDDAAASAIAARLSAEVAGLQQASVNAGQASSLLQIADGAFQNVEDILTRAKSLSVQAGSEQISDSERAFLDQEFTALKDEIDRIANDTEFNGTKLVDGDVNGNLDGASSFAVMTTGGGSAAVTGLATAAAGETDGIQGINVMGVNLATATGANMTSANGTAGSNTFAGQVGTLMLATQTMTAASGSLQFMLTVAAKTTGGGEITNAMFTGTLATGISANAGAVTGVNLTMDATVMLAASSNAMVNGSLTVQLGTAFTQSSAFTTDPNVVLTGQEVMNFNFKVGTGTTATEDEISVDIGGISTTALGLDNASIDSKANADNASDAVSNAIDALQAKRSDVGAAQNRLDFAAQNVELTRENQEAARSELEDLNVAKAITEFSQQQLLVQAGTSTLSQANSLPQNLLQLFR